MPYNRKQQRTFFLPIDWIDLSPRQATSTATTGRAPPPPPPPPPSPLSTRSESSIIDRCRIDVIEVFLFSSGRALVGWAVSATLTPTARACPGTAPSPGPRPSPSHAGDEEMKVIQKHLGTFIANYFIKMTRQGNI